jgi:hypothetical protein
MNIPSPIDKASADNIERAIDQTVSEAASTPRHSPGNWSFDPVELIIYDGDEKTSTAIAIVEQREESSKDSDETSANGWVMAAAPKLLEQCKLLSAALAECYDWKEMEGEPVPAELQAADLIIAKAEGR